LEVISHNLSHNDVSWHWRRSRDHELSSRVMWRIGFAVGKFNTISFPRPDAESSSMSSLWYVKANSLTGLLK
jgi:hypothetical protein